LKGFFSFNTLITKWKNLTIGFVNPSGLEPALQSFRPGIAYRVKHYKLRKLLELIPVGWADLLNRKILTNEPTE
jgi:hypothetical protein